jgi:hypothetical protein
MTQADSPTEPVSSPVAAALPETHACSQGPFSQGAVIPGYASPDLGSSRHSRMSIASFLMSIIGLSFILATFAITTIATVSAMNRGTTNSAFQIMMLAEVAMLVGVLLCIIALLLGIISLYQRGRRLFAVLAISVSGAIILLFGGLLTIGLIWK